MGAFGSIIATYSAPTDLGWGVTAEESGWYQIDLSIAYHDDMPCGDEWYEFSISDSIYVLVPEQPDFTAQYPEVICPGDTLPAFFHCPNCSYLNWLSPFVDLGSSSDSALAIMPGWHTVGMHVLFEGHDCGWSYAEYIAGPTSLDMGLTPSVICPGDTAIVFTNMIGSAPSWLGPDGPLSSTNDTIWVTEPGDYFFETVEQHGCPVGNGPTSLYFAGSPYMDVQPDMILCPGETATIQVFTNDPASIAWSAPFTGSDTVQVVDVEGNYSCTVNYCGTTIPLSVTVLIGDPDATVTGSPFTLCPGQEVVLSGPPEQIIYLWEPMEEYEQTIVVDEPGEYQLIVFDEYGCSDTSAVLQVDTANVAVPLQAIGDTICAGATITLVAQGSGTITWYAEAQASQPLAVSNALTVSPVSNTSYYIVQVDGACTSDTLVISVGVLPLAPSVDLIGPDSVCIGEAVQLSALSGGGFNVAWSTPNGTATGDLIMIDPFTAGDAGQYHVVVDASPCGSSADSLNIVALLPSASSLGPDTALCNGTSIVLELPPTFTNPVWSNGSTAMSFAVNTAGSYQVQALDAQGCAVSASMYVSFNDCSAVISNVITPNGDGVNDAFTMDGQGAAVTLNIFDRWGLLVDSRSGGIVRWNATRSNGEAVSDGVYFYTVTLTTALKSNA
ncbi:MAG TPA: gliding motility-associated C-terminal domain-containing protein, partial [Flavobacteriales bacterium]|nr:gliding motility-associated C-terminal domain-containing protein [Flavobacteriales bacterium]